MKQIELTRGQVALVDDEDYDVLMQWSWYAYPTCGLWYAIRGTRKGGGYKNIRMHRFVMNVPDDMQVDHIDRNGLNNQKDNLRICTKAENLKNKNLYKSNKTGYRGVQKTKYNSYKAAIRLHGTIVHLGTFKSAEEAARAYDAAAFENFGSYANLNFPL